MRSDIHFSNIFDITGRRAIGLYSDGLSDFPFFFNTGLIFAIFNLSGKLLSSNDWLISLVMGGVSSLIQALIKIDGMSSIPQLCLLGRWIIMV